MMADSGERVGLGARNYGFPLEWTWLGFVFGLLLRKGFGFGWGRSVSSVRLHFFSFAVWLLWRSRSLKLLISALSCIATTFLYS